MFLPVTAANEARTGRLAVLKWILSYRSLFCCNQCVFLSYSELIRAFVCGNKALLRRQQYSRQSLRLLSTTGRSANGPWSIRAARMVSTFMKVESEPRK